MNLANRNIQISWFTVAVLGLMPWGLISLGMYGLKDFRFTLILYEICGCLLPVVCIQGFSFPRIPVFSNFNKRLILLSILIGNTALLSAWYVMNPFIFRSKDFLHTIQVIHLDTLPNQIVLASCLILANPILEEMFWRGLIYQQIKQKSNTDAACVISSILFGAWHWVILQAFFYPLAAIGISMIIMIVGLILSLIYEKTGSLLEPILIHSLAGDLPAMILFFAGLNQAVSRTA
jgi:membrane protease YdiL (CAAX protease family)